MLLTYLLIFANDVMFSSAFASLFVSSFVNYQGYAKTKQIFTKVAHGPRKKPLDFAG